MKEFYPNCTFPDTSPVFVQDVNIRTTLDVVWSCFGIILLCTWSVLHLSVPPQHIPETNGQWCRRQCSLAWRKFKWMLVTLLAPEVTLAYVCTDLWSALKNRPTLMRLAREDNVEWSLTHTLFANLGAFAIRFERNHGDEDGDNVGAELSEKKKAPSRHLKLQRFAPDSHPAAGSNEEIISEGFDDFCSHHEKMACRYGRIAWRPHKKFVEYGRRLAAGERPVSNRSQFLTMLLPRHTDIWVVDAAQILRARERGLIAKLPDLTDEDISDRNKSDFIVKAIAVVQVAWLIAQLIVRAVHGLPSTILEIATIAFAACSLVTYALQWYKPKDVGAHIYLEASREATYEDFEALYRVAPERIPSVINNYHGLSSIEIHDDEAARGGDVRVFVFTSAIGAVLFGAIHLLAWNFAFPTATELLLWRIGALAAIIAPVIYSPLLWMSWDSKNDFILISFALIIVLTGFIHVLGRAYLLVESLRQLYYLPPAAYIATWTSNIPHLG